MAQIKETSLIVKKETIFDKIRNRLLLLFYNEEYQMLQKLDAMTQNRVPRPSNIIIPKEMKNIKYEKFI